MAYSSCINTIQGTVNWCAAYILNRPSSGVAGSLYQPALTNANLILATILAPPFAWQWNRSTTSFPTVVGQSDYTATLDTFGWIEKATIDGSALVPPMNPPIQELTVASLLAVGGKNNRPAKISVVNDNNAGTITFRLLPIPDQIYTVNVTYQNAPTPVTSLYQASVGAITSIGAASGNQTVYNASGGITGFAALVGTYVQVLGTTIPAGFTSVSNPNNGLFFVLASTATSLTLQNPFGVVQSGAAGTLLPAVTWAPLPDKYNFLYNRSMLAMLHGMYDSATYLQEMELFLRELVGVSEGLDDTAKAIFLEDRLAQLRTQNFAQAASTATPKKAQ